MSPFGTLKVVIAPNPGLRQVCTPCQPGDKSLVKLAQKMANTMYKNDGCGLAGPQIGVNKRIIVIDCDDSPEMRPITLVNPEIVELSGDPVEDLEGCLSLPGISVPISRQPYARVRYFDLAGKQCEIAGDGLLGRCLQHEIDHLEGRTLLESCTPMARIKAMKDYQEALAKGAKPGDVG